jgi:sterol desaturase/sphingolipid hydroxylase (fatty acid hydroxylase superfamily)
MHPYTYVIALVVISVFVATLERVFPWRKKQRALRPYLWSDMLHLVFNGHLLGVIVYGLSTRYVLPTVDTWLAGSGAGEWVYRDAAADWPVWVQIVVALLAVDLLQWCVHWLLHRVPALWELHKCHHSVVDGEMDWVVAFRFQWTEVVVYKTLLYLPLAWFGFGEAAIMTHAIFGTLIGHLNHANLNLSWGPLRYVLNSPRMHIWHHDRAAGAGSTVNFGIIFSMWDWLFRTAKMPDQPPEHIGFDGDSEHPHTFFEAEVWPLQRLLGRHATWVRVTTQVVGLALMALGYWLATRPM